MSLFPWPQDLEQRVTRELVELERTGRIPLVTGKSTVCAAWSDDTRLRMYIVKLYAGAASGAMSFEARLRACREEIEKSGQSADRLVLELIMDHMERLAAQFRTSSSYEQTAELWNRLLASEVLSLTSDMMIKLASEAVASGEHRLVLMPFPDLTLLISVIPRAEVEACRTYFEGGYNRFIEQEIAPLVMAGSSAVHWILCCDRHNYKINLGVFPANHQLILLLPTELLTPEERAVAGLG